MKQAMIASVALLAAGVGLALVAGGPSAPTTLGVAASPPAAAAALPTSVRILPRFGQQPEARVEWLEEVTIFGVIHDGPQPAPGSGAAGPAAAAMVEPR